MCEMMSKRLIFISIGLITLALVCLIAFQVIWYHNSFELKRQLYDHAIQAALKDVVTRVENREAANTITNRLEFMEVKQEKPFDGKPDSYILPFDEQRSRPVKQRQVKKRILPLQHKDTFSSLILSDIRTLHIDTTSLHKIDRLGSSGSQIVVMSDEKIDSATISKIIVRISKSELKPESLNIENIRLVKPEIRAIKQLRDQLQPAQVNVKYKLNEVLNKLVKELAWSDSSVFERVNRDTLHQIIATALTNNGIHSPFQFAVKKSTSEQTSVDSTGKTAFTIPLFPNDIHSKTITLQLLLPERESQIKQSMYGHLAGSLVFTFIVLFAFAYTIYVMLKQKKLDEIKNDFINNMTHEFKTPIATISLAADTISNQMMLDDKEKIRHYAGVIHEENQRMNSQVEKVLQLALTDKNNFEIQAETIHLHALIHDVLEKFNMIAENENRIINVNLHAQQDVIVADYFHMGNAISNILDNALKYSETGTTVSIETFNSGNSVFISVKDQGIGMKKEVQKKVFDKFYREHTGNIHNVKGFGIGLSYVKNVIDAHRGEISIQSTPGKGSTFTIKLNQ